MIPSILAAVVLALPWLTGSWRPGTLDIAWLLHVADRILDGARYGRDVIEINPPLIAWLMLPVAWVARVAGMQPILAWQGALTLGSAASVLATVRSLPAALPLSRGWLAAFLAFAFTVYPAGAGAAGQRDHLALMLVLPWLAVLARRIEGAPVGRAMAWGTGLAGATGFLLKPHFLAPFVAAELAAWWLRRGRGPAGPRPERGIVLAAMVAYPLLVLLLAPEYIAAARAFGPLYLRFLPLTVTETWLAGGTQPWAVIAAVAIAFAAYRLSGSTLEPLLAAAAAGFALEALVQRKEWPYLWMPAATLAWLVILLAVARSRGRLASGGPQLVRAALVVALVGVGTAYAVRWLESVRQVRYEFASPRSRYNRVRALVSRLADGQAVAVLSPSHGLAFPGVREGGGRWPLRLSGTWPLSALHPEAEGPGPVIRSADAAAWDGPAPVLRMYADDFVADPPRLLFVPLPDPSGRNRAGHNRFDYLGLLARDPRVRELLGQYRCLEPLAGHAVLLRDDGTPSGEWETCGR